MAVFQVKDIDDKLYESLKSMAKQKRRSMSQQVVKIIEIYLANPSLMTPKDSDRCLPEIDRFMGRTGNSRGTHSIYS